jgi:hypothetical protein
MGVWGGGGDFVAVKILKKIFSKVFSLYKWGVVHLKSLPDAEFMNVQFRALLDYRLNLSCPDNLIIDKECLAIC